MGQFLREDFIKRLILIFECLLIMACYVIATSQLHTEYKVMHHHLIWEGRYFTKHRNLYDIGLSTS